MPVFLGFKRKEEMYHSTLAKCNLEEEEDGPTSSSPSFSSGISTRRKAMLSTCKKEKLASKECLLHSMSSIKTELESAYSEQNTHFFCLGRKASVNLKVLYWCGGAATRSLSVLCKYSWVQSVSYSLTLPDLHTARQQQSRLHSYSSRATVHLTA